MVLIHPCIPVFRWHTGTTYVILESDDCRFAATHIVTHYYAASHWVAWSVGLSVALSDCQPCKNGWNDQVAICSRLGWAQWTTYYMRSRCQHGKGQFWGKNRQIIVKYRDTPQSSVQRQLNRSSCHLGCGLIWAESIMCHMGGSDPTCKGAILVDRGTHCKV